MRWIRRATRIVLWLFSTLCVLYSAMYLYGAVQLKRAQKLVATAKAIPVGQMLSEDDPLHRYEHVCGDDGCYRLTSVSNLPYAEFWAKHGVKPPRLMPANWWTVGIQVEQDRNGNVIGKGLVVDDGRYRQFSTVTILVYPLDPAFYRACLPGQFRHPGYNPRREMRTGALLIKLAPDASRQFVERAFDLDLNCLNSRRGCKSPSEIAPEAWHDQEEDLALAEQDMKQNAPALEACWKLTNSVAITGLKSPSRK